MCLSSLKPVPIGSFPRLNFGSDYFLIYVIDLLMLPMVSMTYAYADDSVFLCSHNDSFVLEHYCNHNLTDICNWSRVNEIRISFKNSHCLNMNAGGLNKYKHS